MPLPPYPAPAHFTGRVVGILKAIFAITLLFLSILFCNLFQMLSLLLWPVSRRAFRRVNRFIANAWWGFCAKVAEFYGQRIEWCGDEVPCQENAIVFVNHQSQLDIAVLFAPALAKGRLGDLKWFVKDIVKYVPGVGWGMLFLGCLFVKRNWSADRAHIEQTFATIRKENIPLWLISFVEGTRQTKSKLAKSQEYAKEKGLPHLEHVMIPRTKGFIASLQALRDGHVQAVYDITIGYIGGVPSIWQWCKGQVPLVKMHIRRFAVSDLPVTEDELNDWLIARFVEKDQRLAHYYATDSFELPSDTQDALSMTR